MSPIRNLEAKEIKSIVLSKLYLAHEKGIEIDVNVPQKIGFFPRSFYHASSDAGDHTR